MDGVEFVLDNREYDSYYRIGKQSNKLQLDSKYGLCFRQCLTYIVIFISKKFSVYPVATVVETTLNVVIEGGHKNVGGHPEP